MSLISLRHLIVLMKKDKLNKKTLSVSSPNAIAWHLKLHCGGSNVRQLSTLKISLLIRWRCSGPLFCTMVVEQVAWLGRTALSCPCSSKLGGGDLRATVVPFSKRLNNEITPPATWPFQQVSACSKLHYGTFTTSIKIGSAHQSVIAVPYHGQL